MSNEIQKTENLPAQNTAPEGSPVSMMIQAKAAGMSTEELKDMLTLQKEWEANEARKAFHIAISEFKDEEISITKDKSVGFNDTFFTHASLANIVETTVPFLSKHGLSHSWTTDQTDGTVRVTCTITHKLGHSECTTLQSAPDGSGKKNPIQAIASAITYLERYTFLAITGLATSDMQDDDGAGAVEVEYISDDQLADMKAVCDELKVGYEQFAKVCKVESLDMLPAIKYHGAMQKLEAKRNAD